MPDNFGELPTACDPAAFGIGTTCEIIGVGDSVDRVFGWDVPAVDPETGSPTCGWVPADFTGYVPEALVLDANGATLATMTVTPAIGDATGTFSVHLPKEQVTAGLKSSAVRWTLTIEAGDMRTRLVYAPFRVT